MTRRHRLLWLYSLSALYVGDFLKRHEGDAAGKLSPAGCRMRLFGFSLALRK